VVWYHPSVGQIDVLLKLHRDHLWVYLNDRSLQPATHAFSLGVLVITKNLHSISDLEGFALIGRFRKIYLGQFHLPFPEE
jgi:hypothetical protein